MAYLCLQIRHDNGNALPLWQVFGPNARSWAKALSQEPTTATMSINPTSLRDPWMKGTGFRPTSTFSSFLGEGDGVIPGCSVPPLTVFWAGRRPPGYAAAVRYTAPSGARVFSAGSYLFNTRILTGDFQSVPPSKRGSDPRMQRFFQNALADLTRRH